MAQKYTEARKTGNRKWDAANLDRISVAAPKGTKERWKSAATAHDKSLNQLIVEAVDHQISQDRDKGPCEAQQGTPGGGGISLHPEALQTAQNAAQKAGETVSQFVERAVETQAQRDEASLKLGINPATGGKLEKEA